MSTRPNGIYCHRNNYDILGTSHDSLEIILYSGDEDDHRNFHPQQGSPPPPSQQYSNGSFIHDVMRNPVFSDDEELAREDGAGDDIFQMDDIPNELSSSIASLTSTSSSNTSDDSTSTARLSVSPITSSYQSQPFNGPPSSPIQVRYYAPTNEAPQGLSQSVVITTVDHNYIRRHLNYQRSRLQNSWHGMDDSEEEEDNDDDSNFSNEEEIVNSIVNSDNPSQYLVPFPSSWSSVTGGRVPDIYSQSAPIMTSYLMDDMLFNSAMSILNTAVVLSQPENENENDGDGHSIASNVSSIETVRALSEVLELEENASLCRSSESITVEEQVSLSLGDHAEKKEHFETDSNGSVLPTVEEIANKIQDALAEPIHQDQKEEATMDNDKSESWSLLADECYGPLGRLQLQRQLLEEESRWNRIHQQPDLLEKLKHNGFVLELLNKYSCPLKVSNLPYVTRYKCLQNHFFNPSVLYIRYIRYERCAYVVYRNYAEMMKGYHTFSLTVIEGVIIECEPSTMEELHYGLNREDQRKMAFRNEHNKNIRSKTPTKTTQHGHNRTHSAMTKYNHRDTFIPGHYNIIQNKKSYKNRRINSNYAPNYDYLSQTPMYGYNMAGITSYCALYSYYSPSVPYYMPFSHPHQSNTAMMSWNSDHSLSSFQHNRDKKKGRRSPLPEKTLRMPILPVQYIIMKPNNKQDYSVSGRIRYYPISAKKYVDALNYVFQVSHQVVFLLSIKGSGAFQDYAIMSSEIMDLHELDSKDIKGTSFETLGTNFKTGKGSNKTFWRYVCRVEWKSARTLPMCQVGHCVNGWNNDKLIRYSKDVTFVDPTVGKTMVDIMSASSDKK